jgi:hypothetical protein
MSRAISHLNQYRTAIERMGSITAPHNRSSSMTNHIYRIHRNRRSLRSPDTSHIDDTPRWSAHRKRDALLLLLQLLLGVGTIMTFLFVEARRAGQTGGTQPETVPTSVATASPAA